MRDMNDEINKLFREKSHWERRIVELSGPDYSVIHMSNTHELEELTMGMACSDPDSLFTESGA